MSGPGRGAVRRGLYDGDEWAYAAETIRRVNICHERRIAQTRLGVAGDAVLAAELAVDLVESATPAVLRAMVVQLTTPELRPAVPVVLGPACTCGVMTGGLPDRRRSCPHHGVDELEQVYRDSQGFRDGGR